MIKRNWTEELLAFIAITLLAVWLRAQGVGILATFIICIVTNGLARALIRKLST